MVERSRTWTALVTFEVVESGALGLPGHAHGAVGYMAVRAAAEDDLRQALLAELKEAGLRLVEIDDIRMLAEGEFPDALDGHLAANMREWLPGKRTVWGTVRPYYGDGEA
ncbi:MAG: hypothetical protein AB7U38_12745 [Hyphomicrobiales bacterium]